MRCRALNSPLPKARARSFAPPLSSTTSATWSRSARTYLCHAERGYWERLSPASKHSLELQGGAFTEEEAIAFLQQPFARDAVRLRRWDDIAKVPGLRVPDLSFITELLQDAADCHETAIAGA
jgi:predicted HD phosphohydrolase